MRSRIALELGIWPPLACLGDVVGGPLASGSSERPLGDALSAYWPTLATVAAEAILSPERASQRAASQGTTDSVEF